MSEERQRPWEPGEMHKWLEKWAETHPLARVATPEEYAAEGRSWRVSFHPKGSRPKPDRPVT